MTDNSLAQTNLPGTASRAETYFMRHRKQVLVAMLAVAVALRLIFLLSVGHPGRGDPSYYYALAQNLTVGRGFVIDYIWHYLVVPETITHPAVDYWMPLTAIIIAPFLIVFGHSLIAALLPSLAAGIGIAFLTLVLCRLYKGSELAAYVSAILVLFMPTLFQYSLATDTTIYFVLFAGLSLFFATRAVEKPVNVVPAAIFAGLAHLTRHDGVFLMVAVLLAITLGNSRKRLVFGAAAIVTYLLIMSPLLSLNIRDFGSPLVAGASKTAFLTEYFDMYSYAGDVDLQSYLEWGIGNIVRSKVIAALLNIKIMSELLGGFILILSLTGSVMWLITKPHRSAWPRVLPAIAFFVLSYLGYSFVSTFTSSFGGYFRSGTAIIPFAVILAVSAFERIVKQKDVLLIAMGALLVVLAAQSVYSTNHMIRDNNELDVELARLEMIVEREYEGSGEIIVMTRTPSEIYYSTGLRGVQIPHGEVDLIFTVAERYQAQFLLAPASLPGFGTIYREESFDPRLTFLAEFPKLNSKLYRIRQ